MIDRDSLGHLVVERTAREEHVIRPGSLSSPAKPVDIVDGAHPILAVLAIATIPARNNVFAYGVISHLQAVFFTRSFAQANDFPDKFMPRCNRGLAPSGAVLITPKPGGALETFDVTAANTSR